MQADAVSRLAATGDPRGDVSPRTAPRSTRPSSCAGWPIVVERRGARIYERTRASRDRAASRSHRPAARCTADVVIRATEGYTPRLPGLAPRDRPGLLADHRHRAAARLGLGRDRPGRARDVQRPPAPDHLRATHGGRAAGVRRPRRALSPRLAHRSVLRPGARGVRGPATDARRAVPGAGRPRRSPTPGVGPLGIARDWHASVGFDGQLGWAGGYVGDGVSTDQPGRTHAGRPDRRARRPRSPSCRGSGTDRATGSPNRCAGSAPTPACGRCAGPTRPNCAAAARRRVAGAGRSGAGSMTEQSTADHPDPREGPLRAGRPRPAARHRPHRPRRAGRRRAAGRASRPRWPATATGC